MHTVTIATPAQAADILTKAGDWVRRQIGRGKRVRLTLADEKRTLPQNDKMWGMLGDVSRQVDWYGHRLTDEEWKDVFTAALYKQKVVPAIGGGFVVVGRSTRKMGVKAMSELIEFMHAFGAEHNVEFGDER